jgi:glycine dehydrogenase subunit 1
MGPQGLRETANLCLQKSRYAAERLCDTRRFELAFKQPTFKEFVIRDREGRVTETLADALDQGYLAGVPLEQWYPELADCFLAAVTEKRTKDEMDGLARVMEDARDGVSSDNTPKALNSKAQGRRAAAHPG